MSRRLHIIVGVVFTLRVGVAEARRGHGPWRTTPLHLFANQFKSEAVRRTKNTGETAKRVGMNIKNSRAFWFALPFIAFLVSAEARTQLVEAFSIGHLHMFDFAEKVKMVGQLIGVNATDLAAHEAVMRDLVKFMQTLDQVAGNDQLVKDFNQAANIYKNTFLEVVRQQAESGHVSYERTLQLLNLALSEPDRFPSKDIGATLGATWANGYIMDNDFPSLRDVPVEQLKNASTPDFNLTGKEVEREVQTMVQQLTTAGKESVDGLRSLDKAYDSASNGTRITPQLPDQFGQQQREF